jgi:uncharacterized protein
MPTRVKCLHALAAHSLSAGPGANPIGDIALERSTWSPEVCRCPDYGVDDERNDRDDRDERDDAASDDAPPPEATHT